jgi:putative sigma-54 modulation protein
MKINIHSVHFNADVKLIGHATKKINKLNTFQEGIIRVDVFLKLDNPVHVIKDKVVEISVWIPGYQFFVKHISKSFEQSFDCAFDALLNQIKRKKIKNFHNPRISQRSSE